MAEVVIEAESTFRAVVSYKKINPPLSIKIAETRSWTQLCRHRILSGLLGDIFARNSRTQRHIHKLNGNRRAHLLHRNRRLLRARVFALLAIGQADRSA